MTTASCLTEIDIRIFSLLAEGFTHAEIAVEMGYAKVSIDHRVKRINRHLGVRNERVTIALLARAGRI